MENATEAVAVAEELEPRKVSRGSKLSKKPSKKQAKAPAKAKKAKKAKRLTEVELKAKYPHVVLGTLQFDEKEQRNRCTIKCVEKGCKKTRKVATSDLFQVKRCVECTKEHRNASRKKK